VTLHCAVLAHTEIAALCQLQRKLAYTCKDYATRDLPGIVGGAPLSP
jgi:hypothetical protein